MFSNYKISLVILSFACLLFPSQATLAQNMDAVKSDIYSKLKCCACQVSFGKCSCPEAKEIKAYIDALIENGVTKEDIFYRVAKRFTLNTILDHQIKKEVEIRLLKEAGEKRPQIILDSASFDFGKMSKKRGKVGRVFRVSNKGNAPLVIKGIKTSCPCATVSLKVNKKKSPYFGTEGSPRDWQMEIKPQGAGELELIVDFSSSHVETGKLIRDATITSNDPLYPEVIARVEAQVTD